MLKICFWLLLVVNAGWFAFHSSYLNGAGGAGTDLLAKPFQADKIKLVTPAQVLAYTTPKLAVATTGGASAIDCTEIGDFSAAGARRFASQLAEIAPTIMLVRRQIAEIGSYRVYLPSFRNREAANKKGEELLGLGIRDFFVIQDDPQLRFGISLGIFKTEEAARNQVAHLERQGISETKVEARNASFGKVAFQLRALNPQTKAQLDVVTASFPDMEIRNCAAATD